MNRSPAPVQSNRQVWLIIFGFLVFSVFIYGLLCFFLEHSKSPRTTNTANLAQLRPFTIAFARSEVCAILGLMLFFLGAPLQEFALFGAGTLLVDFAFILPRGLQFWSAMDRRGNF